MKNKIIDLLKSGNFTLAYHDNDYCVLYEGHKDYDELPEKGKVDFTCSSDGYIPDEVDALVKALGGKVVTI